jgi:hypothetical protein
MSATDSQHTATPASLHASLDDPIHSPISQSLDRRSTEQSPITSTISPRDATLPHLNMAPAWTEEQRGEQRALPSLSDMLDHRSLLNSGPPMGDANGFPFPASHRSSSPGAAPPPQLIGGDSRPQTLKKEQPSSSSTTSSGSSFGFPRTPTEASLPIHALLSSTKPNAPYDPPPVFPGPPELKPSFLSKRPNGTSRPLTNGNHAWNSSLHHHAPPPATNLGSDGTLGPLPPAFPKSGPSGPQPHQLPPVEPYSRQPRKPEASLDGMSALLKAGEIVDRQA